MGGKKWEVGVRNAICHAARDRRRFIRGTFIINLSPLSSFFFSPIIIDSCLLLYGRVADDN